MDQGQRAYMIRVGMCHEDGAHIFAFQQCQVWQGITLTIYPDTCIDNDPLLGNFHGQTRSANTIGTAHKYDLQTRVSSL